MSESRLADGAGDGLKKCRIPSAFTVRDPNPNPNHRTHSDTYTRTHIHTHTHVHTHTHTHTRAHELTRRSPKDMQDKTCLRAVVNSPIVKHTVAAYNRIAGKTDSACQLRVRTLSQIGLGIPFKAMQKLGLKGFDNHKFSSARSHAKCYGPGQDPFVTIRRR